MKITVLDAATLGNDIDLSLFNDLGEVEIYNVSPRETVADRIKDADVCVINKVRLDEAVLGDAKKLRLICVAATGYDNIDTVYCKNNGIAVCNVAGYSANSVSQLTLAMVLSASCNLDSFRNSVANGSYSAGNVQNILTPSFAARPGASSATAVSVAVSERRQALWAVTSSSTNVPPSTMRNASTSKRL